MNKYDEVTVKTLRDFMEKKQPESDAVRIMDYWFGEYLKENIPR